MFECLIYYSGILLLWVSWDFKQVTLTVSNIQNNVFHYSSKFRHFCRTKSYVFLERKCFSKENNFSLKVAPTKSWYWVCFWLNKILYCKYGLAYLCIDSHSVHSCKSSTIVVIIFVVIMSHRFSRCAGCCHYFTPWSYTQLLCSWTGYGTAKDAVGGSIWLWLEVVVVVQCGPFGQGQT